MWCRREKTGTALYDESGCNMDMTRRSPGCGSQRLLRCRLHPAGRCPNSSSLHPPQAAVVAVARKGLLAPFRPQRGCRNGKKLVAALRRVAAPSVCFAAARILLAAAPTAPPCFRHWRRSSLLHFFLVSPICCFAAGVTSLLTVTSSRNVKSSAEP